MMRVVLAACAVLLAGCGSTEEPTGVGRGRDHYKKSPCACLPVEQLPADQPWLQRLKDWGGRAA